MDKKVFGIFNILICYYQKYFVNFSDYNIVYQLLSYSFMMVNGISHLFDTVPEKPWARFQLPCYTHFKTNYCKVAKILNSFLFQIVNIFSIELIRLP